MITNKFTAYGLTVAVAFAAAVVLLFASAPTSASADKGTTGDAAQSVTTSGTETNNAVTLKSTHVSGTEACINGSFATSSATNATTTTPSAVACTTITTTAGAGATATDTTLTVASTTGFPDSGSLIIDDDGNADLASGNMEIVDYTGKTSTSFTGVTRARAGTTGIVLTAGDNFWPVVYSQITIVPMSATDTTVNLSDASNIVVGGTVDPDLIFDPAGANEQIETVSAKTGNTLTVTSVNATGFAVAEYVAQIHGINTDTGVTTVTPTAGATDASFKYSYTANGETSTSGTVTLAIVSNNPDAVASEVTVSATVPTPIPIIIGLVGSDSSETTSTASFGFTKLPTKGILGTPTAALCTAVTGSVVGEVLTNCLSQVVYTPLLGATGTDSFDYALTNGGEASAAATVTIVLPGGSPTPTPGAGFTDALVAGVNLTTYGGGTVVQLATDAAAAGATSVSVTSAGAFIVHVVGAPDFVNAAFAANFPGDVPSGQVVLVLVSS